MYISIQSKLIIGFIIAVIGLIFMLPAFLLVISIILFYFIDFTNSYSDIDVLSYWIFEIWAWIAGYNLSPNSYSVFLSSLPMLFIVGIISSLLGYFLISIGGKIQGNNLSGKEQYERAVAEAEKRRN